MNPRILTMSAVAVLVGSIGLAGCNKTEQPRARDTPSGAATNSTTTMGDKIDDAVITTSVKAELAKDTSLSALAINVDTVNGRVALKGTAPTSAAKNQATTLAQNVKGVLGVDNQLTVKP